MAPPRALPFRPKPFSAMDRLRCTLPLLLLVLVPDAVAQEPDEPGPFPVGWRDERFFDTQFGRGNVLGRIYYPALAAGPDAAPDPSAGPYPLVAFQHGWFGRPENYDDLSTHLASWGFLVASIGTETGLFATMQKEAADTQALLHWVEDRAADPSHWLAGMTGDGDWAVSGHSMGGGACMVLIGLEPRIRTLVPLEPYRGPSLGGASEGILNLQAFTGRALFVAGSLDDSVPWDTMVRAWYLDAGQAERNHFFVLVGGDHSGPVDDPDDTPFMTGEEQHRLHRRITGAFLRAEMLGEEDLYGELFGEGMAGSSVEAQAANRLPALWNQESRLVPGSLAVGLAGASGDREQILAWSLTPDARPTPYGILGLDLAGGAVFHQAPAGNSGAVERLLPVQAGWSGQTLYLQGFAAGPGRTALTRTASLLVP